MTEVRGFCRNRGEIVSEVASDGPGKHRQPIAIATSPKQLMPEHLCPGHVASPEDGKICDRCGIHIDSLR